MIEPIALFKEMFSLCRLQRKIQQFGKESPRTIFSLVNNSFRQFIKSLIYFSVSLIGPASDCFIHLVIEIIALTVVRRGFRERSSRKGRDVGTYTKVISHCYSCYLDALEVWPSKGASKVYETECVCLFNL